MKLKFIIIPAAVLLVMYMALAQTIYITTIAMNISIGSGNIILNPNFGIDKVMLL